MSALRLDQKQLRAATPDISAWVSANAGAGKTQVLVNRIARLLLAGAEPASVLCLTYTNAAAAEMAARIYKTLGEWTGLDDDALRGKLAHIGVERAGSRELKRARRLFALALDTPGGFKIQTIHGFCERILQLFPIEAGMAPGFEVLDEKEKAELLQEARDGVLSAANAEPGSELATALDFLSRYTAADNLDAMLDEILQKGGTLLDNGGNHHAGMIDEVLRRFFGINESVTLASLQRDISSIDERELRSVVDGLINSDGKDNKPEAGQGTNGASKEKGVTRRVDILRSQLFIRADGKPRSKPTIYKTKPPDLQTTAQIIIDREYQRLMPLMQQHDGLIRIEATQALFAIARAILSDFATAKSARAAYDFDDLITKTRELLTDKAASAWVLYKLDKVVEHVLIDEAQDTSPPQWDIMKAVTEEFFAGVGRERAGERTFFVVGDQKQSIFSFQGADVRIFESSRLYFAARASEARQVMENVPLTISYRTQGPVLQAVDTVFGSGAPARIALGIEGGDGLVHEPERKEQSGLVELWPLMLAGGKETFDPWQAPSALRETQSPQQLLARKIAATIASWIGKRWLASRERTVQAQDILILFRSRSQLFELLISALREAGVPVSGTDRLKPVDNIAVLDMLALMRMVSLPLDDYSLACVLKSPLVSQPLSEDELFTLCHERKPASLWARLEASTLPNALTCHAELQSYREQARTMLPFEFIQHVLLRHRRDILARLGREADDALAALCEKALEYEASHAASINGFAEWFRAEDLEIKRDMDSGNGEVRLMTVHGAKGLEADIVFLADAANPERGNRDRLLFVGPDGGAGDTPLWKLKDLVASPALEQLKAEIKIQEQSEHCRLLYVGMTRARDELYICGATKTDKVEETWYGMVETALKSSNLMREVLTTEGEIVLRHGAEPVWKDELPQSANVSTSVPECLTRAHVFEAIHARMTPTRLANPEGTVHSSTRAKTGRILHRILEQLPEKPVAERRGFVERNLARNGLGGGLADRLLQIMEGPEAEILFGPESAAEVGLGARLPDGEILSGTIDRLVVRDDAIWIVDYKSDARVPERLSAPHPHLRQLAGYCYGLQMMYPGRPIRAGILWLTECRLEWADASELDITLAELQGL